MTTIYLIRHSESLKMSKELYNADDTQQVANEKLPLSVKGEEKACKLSKKSFLQNIDAIYSSSYVRAISTAKYIAENNSLLINVDDRLNERKLGDTRGVPKEFWLTQLEDENAKTNGGESRREVLERMEEILNEVLEKNFNKNIVLVSHATAITFLLMKWCKLENAILDGKKRHLTFKDKDVINGNFETPEVFKISFDNNKIVDIKLIRDGD